MINSQTTHHILSRKYHWWSAEEYLMYLVIKITSIKLFNSRQHHHQEETIIEKIHGSIHHIVSMWKPTSVEYFWDSLTSNSRDIINTASYLIETISGSPTVTCQIWQVSSETITPAYWTTLLQTDIKECSCHQKAERLLDKKCLSGYLVCNALDERLDTNKTKHYYGACEKNFKEGYNNHTTSFRNKN